MGKFSYLRNEEEIVDELHVPKYPHGPSFEDVVNRAASRLGILEAACGCSLKLERIVYLVHEPVTLAVWRQVK